MSSAQPKDTSTFIGRSLPAASFSAFGTKAAVFIQTGSESRS